jgi:hypothetical protein
MNALLAIAVLLSLSAGAQAKLAAVETPRLTPEPDDSTMVVGPAGAMLESGYFRAPQAPVASGRVFPCRLRLQVFDKNKLAQSCH